MLHPEVYLSENDVIHGKGLRAKSAISKGEIISQLDPGQPVLYITDILEIPAEQQEDILRYGYQFSEHQLVIEKEPERYMNHSCDANTVWLERDTMIAARDIAAGEELTYDYATTELSIPFQFDCQCGSPACRHQVTNLDYLIPAWQKKYGDFLPPHTLRAIAKTQP